MIGGVLNLLDWFFIYIAGTFQNYSLVRQLIERLYSTNEEYDSRGKILEAKVRTKNDKDLPDKISRNIKRRTNLFFSYGAYLRAGGCWCTCCCPKKNDKDKMYVDAQKKLKLEMDVLELIKTLRISNFMATVTTMDR
jgi:hypothetical protein